MRRVAPTWLKPGGREEILETGLTLVDAETLYFICLGEPVHEGSAPEAHAEDEPAVNRRPRQLAFKF